MTSSARLPVRYSDDYPWLGTFMRVGAARTVHLTDPDGYGVMSLCRAASRRKPFATPNPEDRVCKKCRDIAQDLRCSDER